MAILEDISINLQRGRATAVKELTAQALSEGIPAQTILSDGLMAGMDVIGEKFKNNQIFVPDVLIAARAMNFGTQVLKPALTLDGAKPVGNVCIGTVKGDLHDIGKNLVRMMLEGKGINVIDLGTDVDAEDFINAVKDNDCTVICLSSLLTTTMNYMKEVVDTAIAAGIRDKIKIFVGGAPLSEEFCKKIGADVYTPDAASAADEAYNYLLSQQE